MAGETLLDRLKKDEHERRRKFRYHYPFVDEAEWSLAKFLALNLTKNQVAEFLKLSWFRTRGRPSFKNTDELFGWLGVLPQGAEWRSTKFETKGYETVQDEVHLIWRDGLSVVMDLFSNPLFADHMTYNPHIVKRDTEREYSEFFTGTRAHQIQDSLPLGATIVPIILASDRIPVTRQSGGLEMHCIFVTIGNIQSDIRMQPTAHAWRCIAFIPVPAIKIHPEYQTLLQSRLFHWALDVVTASLKDAAGKGCMLTDASGNARNCFTPLVAYIAGLPEQQLVACVSKDASPITMAQLSEFGNPTPAEPRTGYCTLKQIKDLCDTVHPWDLVTFQEAAKRIKLLGVHLPFWRNWRYAEPSLFITCDIRRTLREFSFDHILNWCKTVCGSHTINMRIMSLHQCVTYRHFAADIDLPKMSGRDHRSVARQLVPLLDGAGAASDNFIETIQAMMEFIYRAQDPVYTNSSIAEMERALARFHSGKQCIIDIGARRGANGVIPHFNIPKMELMMSFVRQTKANGALIQHSADVSDLFIAHCKTPFQRTSRQASTYVSQTVELLNYEETIRLFDLYLGFRMAGNLVLTEWVRTEHKVLTTIGDPNLFLRHLLPEKMSMLRTPRPSRNYFQKPDSFISADRDVAFRVTTQPDHSAFSVTQMQALYRLPDLPYVISHYIHEVLPSHLTCPWDAYGNVSTWNKFRAQLRSSFRGQYIEKSQMVQAYPPSEEYPLGYCDAVLLRRRLGGRDVYGII